MSFYAIISADVVSSTTLSKDSLKELSEFLNSWINEMNEQYEFFWGRLVKGDTIECVLDNPNEALRIALMLRTRVKSFFGENSKQTKALNKCGIRIAVGIGTMRTIDKQSGIIDGEAIYMSGRALESMNKISSAFQIFTESPDETEPLMVISSLLNHILNSMTKRQSEILYYRLQQSNSSETADTLGISVQAVNQTMVKVGWTAIKRALKFFEELNFQEQ